jgi:hypothetical protein
MKQGKPTASMRSAAKQGLQLHEEGKSDPNMPKRTLDIGKKIASGQTLADDHITDMAHFHSSHDECPKDCEDLLWGGPAGEIWAKSNLMRNYNTGFASDSENRKDNDFDLNKFYDSKTKLSFEIFSDIDLNEPVEETDDGLIWAPIARSGMLATRPGPNGEKLDSPLIFVPGHSDNQLKEIGLQDIHDAFKDKAHEHVTIPIDMRISGEDIPGHNNRVYQNTGEILDIKIIDSKRTPGEKVLCGLHKFTEPDIKGKVKRGTIPSRSCGLLYDYKNTTTGKVYPISLDHVALTHKPWVGGMAPYGSDEFSDRTYIPMMLSEKPLTINIEHPIEKIQPTKLAQEITITPKKDFEKESRSEFLADIIWGEEPSYGDIENQIGSILERMGGGGEYDNYPIYRCIDCNSDKALVKVNYGVGPDEDAWVVPYTVDDKQMVNLAPFTEWIDVARKWVTDTVDPERDKQQLDKLKMSSDKDVIIGLYLAVTQAERDKAKSKDNSLPDGSYPIEDVKHLHSAAVLAASKHGNYEAAKRLIRRRAKELGVDINTLPGFGPEKKDTSTKMSDPLKEASAKRLGLSEPSQYEPIGGHMKLLAMSEEKMELLGLSEEAKELQRQQNKVFEELNTKLAQSEQKEKETRVASRLDELKGEGFDAFPGILKEYESIALSDDGDIAVKLQLSEHGHNVEMPETATQIAERFIKALPRKDGKIDFGEQATVLTAGVMDRPPLTPKDPNEIDKPRNAVQLAEQWAKDDPTLIPELESMGVALSSDNGKGKQ